MIAKTGRTLSMVLAFLGMMSIASTTLAQGNTFNPYGNSGYADYREFGNPMVSNNPALPGQSVLNSRSTIGRPQANSFQQYTNELDGVGSDVSSTRRGASGSVPYYQAYQRLNSQYNRVYQPNNTKGDKEFYERQKQRDQAYSKALEERDPAKRVKLLRQVEQDSLDSPASATARANAAKGSVAPKLNTGAATTNARTAAPTERRTQAPAPFPSVNGTRRPATSANTPVTRAPNPNRTTAPTTAATRPGTTTPPAPDASSIPSPSPR